MRVRYYQGTNPPGEAVLGHLWVVDENKEIAVLESPDGMYRSMTCLRESLLPHVRKMTEGRYQALIWREPV